MDLFNGEILAYTISDKRDIPCVLGTLNQLPNLSKDCLLHSDQGTIYTSYAYYQATKKEHHQKYVPKRDTR